MCDARTTSFEAVEVFGKKAAYSSCCIDRDTVPNELYCYDLRGSDFDCGTPISIEPRVLVNHAGTIITSNPIDLPEGWKQIRDAFYDLDRDYYSYEAYEKLYDFYEEFSPDWELDVIAICGDWTEYDVESLIADYKYLVDVDPNEDVSNDDMATAIIKELEQRTTVICVDYDSWLVSVF